MKRKSIITLVLVFIFCATLCFGDRQLERSEVVQLLEQLTNQLRDTWIPQGTIKAVHEKYRAPKIVDEVQLKELISKKVKDYQTNESKAERTENLQKLRLDAIPFNVRYEMANEYTMITTELVKFDGERFLWDITVDSRKDSVKRGRDLEGNSMTDEFNVELNGHRVFVWDGENYITYSPQAEHAFIDSTGYMPHSVNGPLTAGLTPWGYGYYSLENLTNAQSECIEKVVDGQIQLTLTINNDDGSQLSFVLDPSRQYSVLSCTINRGDSVISRKYSGYQNVSGYWIPTYIILEKYEVGSEKLIARETWTIDMVNAENLNDRDFNIEYEEDTVIEYASEISDKVLTYRHSSIADSDIILGEKLVFDSQKGIVQQNCATASIKYTLGRMGVSVDDSQLAAIIEEPDNGTNLQAMKSFIENLGLDCRAVKTDIKTIQNLGNCQVILYLPTKKHFVALESIDGEYVRIVDLASKKFYYRNEVSFFDMDWAGGIALIISDNAIEDNLNDLNEDELSGTVGASGYTCTRIIQEYDIIYCQQIGDECMGYYTIYWERWGCEAADNGSCSTTGYYRVSRSPCVIDIFDPWSCTVTGDTTNYWIGACM
jgi:hypothetical protein